MESGLSNQGSNLYLHNCRTTAPANLFRIVAGDFDRYVAEGSEQAKLVKRVVKHPRYNHRTTDNDIALFELDDALTYDRYVQVKCKWNK